MQIPKGLHAICYISHLLTCKVIEYVSWHEMKVCSKNKELSREQHT